MATICLSGLDLSFTKTNPLPKEKKRRAPRRVNPKRSDLPCPSYMPDIRPFISYVGKEPELISSRKHLRDHERAYNVYQVGDDIRASDIIAENHAKKRELEELSKGVEHGWTTFTP